MAKYVELEDVIRRLDNAIYRANHGFDSYLEAMKKLRIAYVETIPSTEVSEDCISRQQAVEAIEGVDWYHVNSKGELVSGSTSDEESWYKAEDIYEALESLKPVMPPGKVLAEIKVDTEEVVEKIKEECQLMAGEWIPNNGDECKYICSKCCGGSTYEWNFCPNCGARMKG